MSKPPPPAPTASAIGPCPTVSRYRFSVCIKVKYNIRFRQAPWWDICNKMLFNIFGLIFEESRSGETRSPKVLNA